MSILSKIIRYFTSHDTSQQINDRTWHRLGEGPIDKDSEQAIEDVWHSHGEASLDPDFIDNAWDNVAKQTGLRQSPHMGAWLLRAASWVIPIVLLAGAAWLYHGSREERKELAETSFVQVFSAKGELKHLFLPDSSEVWLNSGSVLVYPSQFIDSKRNITLIGEAFFKVRHNEESSFQVSVNHLKVNDIGTEFNISSYPNQDETLVTLVSGAVSVDVADKTYELKPDHQLAYSAKTGKTDISKVTADDYSAWRTGAMCFNDENLRSVLTTLEYHYNVRFHVMTSRFDSQHVRLRFEPNEKLDNVLSVLSAVVPGLQYEQHGQDIYIR